ncbi:MAG: hypothetical protein ACK4UT_06015, partial [Moraxellaceae bacterium]
MNHWHGGWRRHVVFFLAALLTGALLVACATPKPLAPPPPPPVDTLATRPAPAMDVSREAVAGQAARQMRPALPAATLDVAPSPRGEAWPAPGRDREQYAA